MLALPSGSLNMERVIALDTPIRPISVSVRSNVELNQICRAHVHTS